jgi:hypothetical protein
VCLLGHKQNLKDMIHAWDQYIGDDLTDMVSIKFFLEDIYLQASNPGKKLNTKMMAIIALLEKKTKRYKPK